MKNKLQNKCVVNHFLKTLYEFYGLVLQRRMKANAINDRLISRRGQWVVQLCEEWEETAEGVAAS